MALLTLTSHKAFAGLTGTDTVRDGSLQEMIDEACGAVVRHCQNGALERTAYTQIVDLQSYPSLVVPYAPVWYAPSADPAIDFSLYVNLDANGDPSAFTSAHLLAPYQDYRLETGPTDITTSESGIVRFINGIRGVNRERPLYSLSTKVVPSYGAVKLVYTAGYTASQLAPVRGALNLIVRKIFNMRRLGVPMVSESLNGYSYSSQNNATANGIIQGDPTIRDMLKTFCRPQVGRYA